MQEHQRLALPLVAVVDAHAVDLDERGALAGIERLELCHWDVAAIEEHQGEEQDGQDSQEDGGDDSASSGHG